MNKSKSFLFCLVLIAAMGYSSAHAFTCFESFKGDLKIDQKVPALTVLALHKSGLSMVGEDFSGPGLCWRAEKSLVHSEESDYTYDRLGIGRGAATPAYLIKRGPNHGVWFNNGRYSMDESRCQAELNRDIEQINYTLQQGVSGYDASTGLYSFAAVPVTQAPAELREIHATSNGKGVTLRLTNNPFTHVVCHFSRATQRH